MGDVDVSELLGQAFGGSFNMGGGGGFNMGGGGGGKGGGSRGGGGSRAQADGLYDGDANVINLSPSNFPTQGERSTYLVMFYAPW
jgi:hypothetical protein